MCMYVYVYVYMRGGSFTPVGYSRTGVTGFFSAPYHILFSAFHPDVARALTLTSLCGLSLHYALILFTSNVSST